MIRHVVITSRHGSVHSRGKIFRLEIRLGGVTNAQDRHCIFVDGEDNAVRGAFADREEKLPDALGKQGGFRGEGTSLGILPQRLDRLIEAQIPSFRLPPRTTIPPPLVGGLNILLGRLRDLQIDHEASGAMPCC
ncbi:hypothetical protein DSM3645_02773 [Blastopirellula marina DSM 3645]|uniref:Uncharacterized protein n=1 Tax=Blastopirellula marina DSM 3645 TaxID=314230 RepID=A3ZVL8_9BACT|nr:hypothetical protein DSM3645_02773 [Blastopirellula marina DSM 3645]